MTTDELKRTSGDASINPGLDLVLCILTCSLWGFYVEYRNAQVIHRVLVQSGFTHDDKSTLVLVLNIAAMQRCESDDAAAECGWPDADADGYDALRVDLAIETEQPARASTMRGSLTLAGITIPDCTFEPAPDPDDGGGAASPGCAGEQQTQIETGTIGAP